MAILRRKAIPAGCCPMGPASKIRCAAGKFARLGLNHPPGPRLLQRHCDRVRIHFGPRPHSSEAEHILIVDVNIVGVYAGAIIRV